MLLSFMALLSHFDSSLQDILLGILWMLLIGAIMKRDSACRALKMEKNCVVKDDYDYNCVGYVRSLRTDTQCS